MHFAEFIPGTGRQKPNGYREPTRIASYRKAKFVALHLAFFVVIGSQLAGATIIDEDNRQEIEHFSLSQDELAALYQTVGTVECRRDAGAWRGTAFVIDGGRNLLSNAHVFREGDQRCTFSRKRSNQTIPLQVDKATAGTRELMRNAESRPKGSASRDWIIVPLVTRISTPVFKLGAAPDNGEELLLVGVRGEGKELDRSNLVGRRCTAEERHAYPTGQDALVSDCDTIPGDSGAPVFVRRNGVLEVVAINTAAHILAVHGKSSHLDRDMTFGLIIDGPLRETIDNRFRAAPSTALLKPFHDPNYKSLIFSPRPVADASPGRTIRVEVTPPSRDELSVVGMKLRDLTPDDQILYGIPDNVRGVLVSSVGSRTDVQEGEVLLSETLGRLSKLRIDGVVSLTVNIRKMNGQTIRQTLSIE